MFIIGIDPHKGSHTAAVIDGDEQLVGELSVRADRRQRERLLRWAAPFEPRLWAVEGATGHGALLAQQLVGVGRDRGRRAAGALGDERGCWTRAIHPQRELSMRRIHRRPRREESDRADPPARHGRARKSMRASPRPTEN